jgi:hypothetical protein
VSGVFCYLRVCYITLASSITSRCLCIGFLAPVLKQAEKNKQRVDYSEL